MGKSNKEERPLVIQVTTGTMIRALALMVGVVFAYFLRDVVLVVLAALLLATLIDPFAHQAARFHIPRSIAVLFVYLIFALVCVGIFVLVVPTVIDQGTTLLDTYSPYLGDLTPSWLDVGNLLRGETSLAETATLLQNVQESGVSDAIPSLLSVLASIFGGLLTVLLTLFLAFYLVVEEEGVKKHLVRLIPERNRTVFQKLFEEGRKKIGYRFRGQLLLMILVGLLYYVALRILGVPYAAVLAVIGGLLEVVPFIGPNVAAVPAVVVALSISPVQAILVAISYFVVQQIEADILTPKIMQKVTGLNPAVVIIAIMVGYGLGGVLGSLLAVPIAVVAQVAFNVYMDSTHKKSK